MDPVEHRRAEGAGVGTWRSVVAMTAGVSTLLVVLDQWTKAWATRSWGPDAEYHRLDLIGDAIGFEFVRNTGVAFGLLQGRQWLVSVLSIAVLTVFLFAFRRDVPGHRLLQVAIGAIVGGALGNLIDRFRLGYVVDFIAIGTFPRFNVADSAVTIGLVLIVWFLLGSEQPRSSTESTLHGNKEHDIA